MKSGQTMLARIAVVALLASCLVAVVPGPAKAQLTLRTCTSDTGDDILRGDGFRKLCVCVCVCVCSRAGSTATRRPAPAGSGAAHLRVNPQRMG
jgi:hypothetical protein